MKNKHICDTYDTSVTLLVTLSKPVATWVVTLVTLYSIYPHVRARTYTGFVLCVTSVTSVTTVNNLLKINKFFCDRLL